MQKITVIGSGTMGNGIAHCFAQSGYKVALVDVSEGALQKAITTIEKNLDRMLKKESISEKQKQNTVANISIFTSLADGVKDSQLVVEAASENIDIKLKIFKELDELCDSNIILASNTSSISITKIASVTKRADKIGRAHV